MRTETRKKSPAWITQPVQGAVSFIVHLLMPQRYVFIITLKVSSEVESKCSHKTQYTKVVIHIIQETEHTESSRVCFSVWQKQSVCSIPAVSCPRDVFMLRSGPESAPSVDVYSYIIMSSFLLMHCSFIQNYSLSWEKGLSVILPMKLMLWDRSVLGKWSFYVGEKWLTWVSHSLFALDWLRRSYGYTTFEKLAWQSIKTAGWRVKVLNYFLKCFEVS